jgi:hypothetical protein
MVEWVIEFGIECVSYWIEFIVGKELVKIG